jgi:hypothetical protein
MTDEKRTASATRSSGAARSIRFEGVTKRGFPLASLVLLATALAVCFTCTDVSGWSERWGRITPSAAFQLFGLFVAAALVGAVIGAILGLSNPSRWRGVLFGFIGGTIAGDVALLILLAPAPPIRSLTAVAVLIATAILVRWSAQ